MVCFAALAVAAIAFVYWFLPETKGLPVEEIVHVFEQQRGIGLASPPSSASSTHSA
jgi:Sugar (and other) transporter